jgi:urease accessory protein
MRLLRLLQLASPALPVGGYSYSQGLEAAVNAGLVTNASDASNWLFHLLRRFVGRCEAPLVLLTCAAFDDDNAPLLADYCAFYLASRETAAARDETRQMAWSLRKLALELKWLSFAKQDVLQGLLEPVYPVVFAMCATALGIESDLVLFGYLFAWLENQVIALQKLAPVGQSAGQLLLHQISEQIPAVLVDARRRAELGVEAIETMAPHLGILMSRHESQYSRIFRT